MFINRWVQVWVLLDECKYEDKNKKVENLVNDDLELTSSDNESDNESDSK